MLMRNRNLNYISTSFISSSCTWVFFYSASSNFNFTFVRQWIRNLPGFCSSPNTGSHWQCSHSSRSGHWISPVAFIKGPGKQLNIYLKCDTWRGKERSGCSSGRQCFCGCHSSSRPSATQGVSRPRALLTSRAVGPHSPTSTNLSSHTLRQI